MPTSSQKQNTIATLPAMTMPNMLKQNNAAIDNATAQSSAAEMTSTRYRYFLAFNPIEQRYEVTRPGPDADARGCLLERTWRGKEPLQLPSGETPGHHRIKEEPANVVR